MPGVQGGWHELGVFSVVAGQTQGSCRCGGWLRGTGINVPGKITPQLPWPAWLPDSCLLVLPAWCFLPACPQNALSRDVATQLRTISSQQSKIREMKNKLALFRQASGGWVQPPS